MKAARISDSRMPYAVMAPAVLLRFVGILIVGIPLPIAVFVGLASPGLMTDSRMVILQIWRDGFFFLFGLKGDTAALEA